MNLWGYMKNKYTILIIITLLAGLIGHINRNTCNKPGSIAEKINWAGHNCKYIK